jgi:hypothetical protein
LCGSCIRYSLLALTGAFMASPELRRYSHISVGLALLVRLSSFLCVAKRRKHRTYDRGECVVPMMEYAFV